MSKKAHERALDENEAQAVAKMLRVSPQKLNLVAGLIRGRMGKIMKPFANLTIVVRQVEEAAAQAKA
jgi:large subunit ribosomal protein L22